MENIYSGDGSVYYDRDGRLYYRGYDVPIRREHVAPKSVGFDSRDRRLDAKPTLAKKVSLERKLSPKIHLHAPAASIDRHVVTSTPTRCFAHNEHLLHGSLERTSSYESNPGWNSRRAGRPLPAPPRDASRGREREWVEMNSLSRSSITSDRYLLADKPRTTKKSQHRVALYVPLLVFGLFLIACGVINSMFCADAQLYFRFWAGVLVSAATVLMYM